MKIVQVCNHYSPCVGGVERVVNDISRMLVGRGHEVKVVCLDRCANSAGKLQENETIGGIEVERVPFLDLKYYKIAPSVLWKLGDADVVHVHGIGFFSDFLILKKFLHGKKIVVSTHGGIFHTPDIGLLKRIYFNFVQRLVLGFADAVVAVSRNDLELFSKICKKTVLVENGIDLSRFHAGKKKKNTFLFVGRFSKNKRVEKLIDTFAALKEKNFELIIAGTDWEGLLGAYRKKVSECGIGKNVKFVLNPADDEVKGLYSSSEFFVSASEYEGFGISLVEAMASGCIPIVHGNRGFSKIIGGGNGFMIDFGGAESAAQNLLNAATAKSAQKSELARGAIKRAGDFSWDKGISGLEALYGGVLDG